MAARQEHGAPAQFSETDGRDFSDVTPSPTWVRVRPAVSVFGASMDTVSRLSRQGFRAINIEPAQSILSPIHGRRDGRLSQSPGESGLISAVLDTSVTVIETAGLGAGFSIRALARAVGLALSFKTQYHAVLLAGCGFEIEELVRELEMASGKTLGPDFGLCRDETAFGEPGLRSVWASDRRAAESVRTLFVLPPRFAFREIQT